MARTSWLDDLIQRFQHRWETNPQYRAAMSGVLGLIFLITMCTCVSLVTAGANVALASLGFGTGSNDQGSGTTGTKEVKGFATFPVTTYVPQTPNAIPQGTVPSSGTPMPTPTSPPTPTDTPTPTPCTANCGGGGGGGNSGTVTGTPLGIWRASHTNQLLIHTSQPNVGVSVIINNLPGVGTVPFQPAGVTNQNGDFILTWTAPANLGDGAAQATITADFSPPAVNSANIPCSSK